MNKIVSLLLFLVVSVLSFSQSYWQQHVDYKMDIDFDTENHQFDGKQILK